MIQNIIALFEDPLKGKLIWTGLVCVSALPAILLIRRLLGLLKIDEEQIDVYKKWTVQIGLIICLIVLVRIWAYQTLQPYLDEQLIQKLAGTAVALLIWVVLMLGIRGVVRTLKLGADRARKYKRWATYITLMVLIIYLISIWVGQPLLKSLFFKKLIMSAVALAFVYTVVFFIRRFINSLKIDIRRRHQYRKRVTYAATFLYILVLIPIWAGSMPQWATVLSVIGAGVALALHEVLLNMAGWVYIVTRRPYKDGDRIELGEVRGDVIDIQLFQTTLLELGNWVEGDQSTGRIVHLPHGQIFRKPLFNYTKGFEYIWNELSVTVTFESDWEKAREIMLKCGEEVSREIQETVQRKIDRMAKEYLIYYKRFTPIVYTMIEDSGVKLTLRYLTDTKMRRSGTDQISKEILKAFDAEKAIEFAYPTYRIYRAGEGGQAPHTGGKAR